MADEEVKTEEATSEAPVEEAEAAVSVEVKGAGLRFKKSRGVCRKCRRAGEKLFLKGDRCFSAKCSFTRRSYPPGQHGNKRPPHLSQYGVQLREKQKLAAMYKIREKQLLKYYTYAAKKKGKTGEILMQLVERRLDNVVFRAAFTSSRREARQEVSHGRVKVNGRKVDIPSYSLKAGDEIELIKKREVKQEKAEAQKSEIPSWLKVDTKKNMVQVLNLPKRDDLREAIDEQLIVEFYSK
jgi:small subunit ribosomal protein S4